MADHTRETDRLYQLPLDEFTPARNAMAKELKQPEIKQLEKPNVAAWAVNQLYWHHRAIWDRLMKAAEGQRAEHRKLLGGKPADIRATERAHKDAVREGVDAIKELLKSAGQASTQATLAAVQETLESLPSLDPPGRLTKPLKPMGFEALSGVTVRPGLRVVPKPDSVETEKPASQKPDPNQARRLKEQAAARAKQEQERKERQREAERALKTAEAAMLRAEDAVKKAEKTLAEVRAARDAAVSEYQRARLRAHE